MRKGIVWIVVYMMISFGLVACGGGTAQAAWQNMVCKPDASRAPFKMSDEHFMVDFAAGSLRSGEKVYGGGAPRDWDITNLVITKDVIKFEQKIDFGGTVLVGQWNISRKNGRYIRNKDSKTSGQCLINNKNTF